MRTRRISDEVYRKVFDELATLRDKCGLLPRSDSVGDQGGRGGRSKKGVVNRLRLPISIDDHKLA